MKLYTEEQMLQAYDAGFQDFKEGLIGRSYYVVESITPIELPSDEEIETNAVITYKGKDFAEQKSNTCLIIAFEEGAKWMKEQILNQNK